MSTAPLSRTTKGAPLGTPFGSEAMCAGAQTSSMNTISDASLRRGPSLRMRV
jgi:hypothetical protein